MKNRFTKALGVFSTVLLVSCGGGGGGTPAATAPLVPSSSIQRYAGNFSSPCEHVEEVVNLDLGGEVFARTYSTITPLQDKVGAFSFRIDFFADAQCATAPLGSLSNTNPDSRISIVGAVQLGAAPADKVEISVRPSSEPFVPGGTSDVVVFGTAVRLALPSFLMQAWNLKDVWRLEGGRLFEGGLDLGADGFPLSLDQAFYSVQVAAIPARPDQPCSTQKLEWTVGAATCSAQLPVALSTGASTWMDDLEGASTGRASFTCVNGAWSVPGNATCTDSTPPQPACPEQSWTWTVNGNTCTGSVPANHGSVNDSAVNVTPGLRGAKHLSCVASSTSPTGFAWSEFIFAPTNPTATFEICEVDVVQPPVTDPLQILQNKNCLLCHGVSNAEPRFLSFETIAAFYRSNPPAPGVLEAKIKSGGIGVFLDFPMTPNPQISDDELAIVVPWILSR